MKETRLSKVTTSQMVERFKTIHGDKYDYSLINYKTSHIKVKIICPIHGEFEQTPISHFYNKSGCSKCGKIQSAKAKTKTVEDFISEAQAIHGNRYDYSLVEYVRSNRKVEVICREHGVFEIAPKDHITQKSNCSKCALKTSKRRLIKDSQAGWSKTDWVKLCGTRTAKLYILRCWNTEEEFIKVGITCKENIRRRYTTKKSMPYQYEVLKTIESKNASYIYDLENIILRASKDLKYTPKEFFNGITECRRITFRIEDYIN
jgi:hypothetical protein